MILHNPDDTPRVPSLEFHNLTWKARFPPHSETARRFPSKTYAKDTEGNKSL